MYREEVEPELKERRVEIQKARLVFIKKEKRGLNNNI